MCAQEGVRIRGRDEIVDERGLKIWERSTGEGERGREVEVR